MQCNRCQKHVDDLHTTIRAVCSNDEWGICQACATELQIWLGVNEFGSISGLELAGYKVLPNGTIAELERKAVRCEMSFGLSRP